MNQKNLGEHDPLGFSQHTPGAKLDAGKNRLGLVISGFAQAIEQVGRVGTYGATKYTPSGWRSVSDGDVRYLDAMYRHLLRHASGEAVDPDTGINHLAHAAWNVLAVLELSSGARPPVAQQDASGVEGWCNGK